MGRMKDQLIDQPCHHCGKVAMLEFEYELDDGKQILLCEKCKEEYQQPEGNSKSPELPDTF